MTETVFTSAEEFQLLHHQECPEGDHHCLIRRQMEQERKALERLVCLAEHTKGGALPWVYTPGKMRIIIKYPDHLVKCLVSLLRLGIIHQVHQASTERYPQGTRMID